MSYRVFTTRMPLGIAGNLSRGNGQATVEPQVLDTTDYPTAFGVPLVMDATSHAVRKMKANDTAANVYGFYVRPYPTQGTVNTDVLGATTAPSSGIANVLKRGYITTALQNGAVAAAAKAGQVYVRIAAAEGLAIGGIEASLIADETEALTGAYFTGEADADGNVEIAYNL